MFKTISAIFLITFLSSYTCLELSPVDNELLPSSNNRQQLIDIMVEVKTEGDVKTIGGFVGQLREMLTKLVNAQNRHRAIHAKMMKQCIEEDQFRRKEVKAARDSLSRALKHRTKCVASRKQATAALPALVRTLKTYVSELKRATQQRNVERAKYLERREAFRGALKFLADFIRFVKAKLGKSHKAFALAEMSENLLKHSVKLNMMVEVSTILGYVAVRRHNNYTYSANQKLGGGLRAALDNLVKRLRDDAHKNDVTEANAAAAFKKYSARLNKVIGTLRRTIKRLKEQIVRMTKCIDEEDKIIKASGNKIARNELLRKKAAKMCDSFNKDFIEATYNRLDEIKTMKTILKIVAKRFKKLPRDLIQYLNKVENGWIKYVNSTKFQKFKEYERKKYAINQRGALLAKLKAKNDLNPVAAVVKGKHGIY